MGAALKDQPTRGGCVVVLAMLLVTALAMFSGLLVDTGGDGDLAEE